MYLAVVGRLEKGIILDNTMTVQSHGIRGIRVSLLYAEVLERIGGIDIISRSIAWGFGDNSSALYRHTADNYIQVISH